MKVQTSLEFLIITAAIGALIVTALAQYGTAFSQAKQIENLSYANYSVQSNDTYIQRPYLNIDIPINSSADRENTMHIVVYGCANGTVQASLNSSSVLFDPQTINESFYSAGLWQVSFYPNPGPNRITALYKITCQGKIYAGSELMTTISSIVGGPPYQQPLSAYISARNESIVYLMDGHNISSLSESSHCTIRNAFSGQPFGIDVQCGTEDAWQYMTFSPSCSDHGSQTITICIVPSYSDYALGTPNQYGANAIYIANVSITGGVNFSFPISSQNNRTQIAYSGKTIGNASVINVSYQSTPPDLATLSGNSSGFIGSSDLEQYQQAENNLNEVLGYYNSTEITSSSQEEINQTISAYENSVANLLSSYSPTTAYPCKTQHNLLECVPETPFYYTINIYVSNQYLQSNQTISDAGSVLRLFN